MFLVTGLGASMLTVGIIEGLAEATALVGPVYGHLDPRLVGPAGRSLLSHLLKLEQEGQVARAGGEAWSALR